MEDFLSEVSSGGDVDERGGVAGGTTRRDCLTSAVLALGIRPASGGALQAAVAVRHAVHVDITVNGNRVHRSLDPRVTLLDFLCEHLGLNGTKKGCDHGQCGACTVLLNGARINSCLTVAASHQEDSVITIEGLANGEKLHPIQAAFLRNDGFQCGYCTPGQICSAAGLLDEAKRGDLSFVTTEIGIARPIILTELEIRERMSGNLCRCGAYPGIVASVAEAAKEIGSNESF